MSGYSGQSDGSQASSTQLSQQSLAATTQHKLAMAELQDKLQDQEEELIKAKQCIRDAKDLETTRKKEIKDLNVSLSEANETIRCLKVELDALNARHVESVRLSETYISEARLARDEEIARVEEQLDAVKGLTGGLRQENELLKSQMKKMEQSKRDAERELQRAVNRFEAAVQSLEQLEHQYALLEKDAQETEATKVERILSLEQEVEDLRVSKGNLSNRLQQTGEALKDAEQRQLKAEEARAEAVAERSRVQAKLERLEALVENVTSENQSLMASQAKLQGVSDGAAEMTRSMQSMLQTYENENAALVSDLNDVRSRLALMEERRREEQDATDAMRTRAGNAERQLEDRAREATKREEQLTGQLEALQRDHESQEAVWKAERESLKRELELAMGQLSVARIVERSDALGKPAATEIIETRHSTHVEPASSSHAPHSQTFYSAHDEPQSTSGGISVSIGSDGIVTRGAENVLKTPCTVTSIHNNRGDTAEVSHTNEPALTSEQSPTSEPSPMTHTSDTSRTVTKQEKDELKAQLNALKLSLLTDRASTPAFPKVSRVVRTDTTTSLSGYLQAHRPVAMPRMDVETAGSPSTSEDEDDDVSLLDDQLETARSRIHRAKTALRRIDRHAT